MVPITSAPDRLSGFRPTGRHWGIALCFAVLWWLGYVWLAKIGGRIEVSPRVSLMICFSPWLLGVLIIVLDRPGPVRNWLAPLLTSLLYPALGFWYDSNALIAWMRHGTHPSWTFLIVANALLGFGFTFYFARMCPKRCPRCERRCLIPLLRLFVQEKRTAMTHWCASCGAEVWKDPEGQWRKERRRTWLQEQESGRSE